MICDVKDFKIIRLNDHGVNESPFGDVPYYSFGNYAYVILSEDIVDLSTYIQKRKHHKKRINKKWRKQYGMIHPPLKNVMLIGNILYVHPLTWKRIHKTFEKEGVYINKI